MQKEQKRYNKQTKEKRKELLDQLQFLAQSPNNRMNQMNEEQEQLQFLTMELNELENNERPDFEGENYQEEEEEEEEAIVVVGEEEEEDGDYDEEDDDDDDEDEEDDDENYDDYESESESESEYEQEEIGIEIQNNNQNEPINEGEGPQKSEPIKLFSSPLLKEPLYPGSTYSLKDTLLMLLQWQSKNEMSLRAFEDNLNILFNLLPKPNKLPTTIHQLNSLINFNLSDYEEHVCPQDHHLFKKIKKEDWKNHVGDVCPDCSAPRFKTSGQKLVPQKKFYRIPIVDQIQMMTKDPLFEESMRSMYEEIINGLQAEDSFWGASLVQPDLEKMDLNSEFLSLFFLSLGLDGVQCFRESQYSVWPMVIKIWNLHPQERTSGEFILIVGLIPGIFLFYFLFLRF